MLLRLCVVRRQKRVNTGADGLHNTGGWAKERDFLFQSLQTYILEPTWIGFLQAA